MKKIIWKIILALFVILLIATIKPIRTTNVMRNIAKEELREPPFGLFTEAYYKAYKGRELEGPIITDMGNHVEFRWYKLLEWGDTASVYVDVFKYPSSFSWRDDFFWPRLGMKKFYYYSFPDGTSKFVDILPNQIANKSPDRLAFKFYHKQEQIADSINFIINPDRLFSFLQKGYFQIVEKNDDYTIVDFYEPIANMGHRRTYDTISTISAKVFFNDSLEVLIMPYDVPIELRNK